MRLILRTLELPKGILRVIWREIEIIQKKDIFFYKIPIIDSSKYIFLKHKIEENNEAYIGSTKKNWACTTTENKGITADGSGFSEQYEWGNACNLPENPGRRLQRCQERK